MTHIKNTCLIAFIGGAILLSGCGKKDITNEEVLANMKKDPVLAAVIESDPKVQNEVEKAIDESAAMPTDARARRLHEKVQPLIKAHLQERIQHLDDPMMIRFAQAMAQVAMQRSSSNSPQCLPSLQSEQTFLDLLPQDEAKSLVQDIARMQPKLDPVTATREVLANTMAQRLPDIASRGQVTTDQVMDAYINDVQTPPSVTCKVMSGTLSSLASMPPAEGAPLIRTLMKW